MRQRCGPSSNRLRLRPVAEAASLSDRAMKAPVAFFEGYGSIFSYGYKWHSLIDEGSSFSSHPRAVVYVTDHMQGPKQRNSRADASNKAQDLR